MPTPTRTPHDIRRIAIKAYADEKTVRRFLQGKTTKPTTGQRLQLAIDAVDAEDAAKAPAA